jgi:cyclase
MATGRDPAEWAREVEGLGAGEILLTSIERDGLMEGYDLDTIRSITAAVSIPVIASGGAGNYEHMRAAVQDAGASAVAAASLFHFTQQTPAQAKRALAAAGIPVRTAFGAGTVRS